MNANESATRKKSINGIVNQANRLRSVCNEARNFKRADVIRAIAFRYYDNIRACVRACVGRFNYYDNSEYDKEYLRAQYMYAIESATRKKSINDIVNQANRLMSVCYEARNFKRADVIRAIAFRYYGNIRACVGWFNYDDYSEYNKEYSRAQYMYVNESATRKKSINGIMNQANRLMSVCYEARNFKRADVIRAIAFRYYDNIRACVRACVGWFNYDDKSEYNKEYSRAQYMYAIESVTRKKSITGIMNQADRLMSVCYEARNFKRADVIREISFRYYGNIRACVGWFNYDDKSEYDKEYSRAQYMYAIESVTRKKSITGIMNQANRLMSVCNGARNFKRADVIRAIAFRYYDNIRACVRTRVGRFNYNDNSEYDKEYSRAQYMNVNESATRKKSINIRACVGRFNYDDYSEYNKEYSRAQYMNA